MVIFMDVQWASASISFPNVIIQWAHMSRHNISMLYLSILLHYYIEELLGSGLENREYGLGDPLHWPRNTLYPKKLALTSPISGGRSVGIIRLRSKVTEFVCLLHYCTSYTMILPSQCNHSFLHSPSSQHVSALPGNHQEFLLFKTATLYWISVTDFPCTLIFYNFQCFN
jgi:hypothetical protein